MTTISGDRGYDYATYRFSRSRIIADLSASVVVGEGHDTLVDIQGVSGSPFDDIITGDAKRNSLFGDLGSDVISGQSGRDVLMGAGFNSIFGPGRDRGNDELNGGSGIDEVLYHSSWVGVRIDLASGLATGEGSDTLTSIEGSWGSHHADEIIGNDQANVVLGPGGADSIYGGAGDDELLGWFGNDTIFGEDGDDLLDGGRNKDGLNGGPGTDDCRRGETVTECESSNSPATSGPAVRYGIIRSESGDVRQNW